MGASNRTACLASARRSWALKSIAVGIIAFCFPLGAALDVLLFFALLTHMVLIGYMLLALVALVVLCGAVLVVVFTYHRIGLIIDQHRRAAVMINVI